MKAGATVILVMIVLVCVVLAGYFVLELITQSNDGSKDWCKFYNIKAGDTNVNWACCVQILEDAGCSRSIDGFCDSKMSYEQLQQKAVELYKQYGPKCAP
jgi:hypothetical protein